MRQMEEQYVVSCSRSRFFLTIIPRFTSYDYKKMQRRSYYPQQNPQLVSTATATSSTGVVSSRPVTPMTIANDGVVAKDSLDGHAYSQKLSGDHVTYDPHAMQMTDLSEKTYAP